MSYTFQTNTTSLVAQQNLRTNTAFQSRTIERLTSGYRINSSADDAAGLAVANKFRSDTAELTQGVLNANDGVSQLQITDGGLSNISNILDRMKTLATEAASSTFTGDRATLQAEYSSLTDEINRQAANVGLGTGSASATSFLKQIGVYIGGGAGQTNASVSLDLTNSAVDANSLGLTSSIDSAGSATTLVNNDLSLNGSTAFLQDSTQAFTFTTSSDSYTVTVEGGSAGVTGSAIVDQMNKQLADSGISVSVDSTGNLVGSSSSGFTMTVDAATGSGTAIAGTAVTATNAVTNSGMYTFDAGTLGTAAAGTITFTQGTQTFSLTTSATDTRADTISNLKAALKDSSISVIDTGTEIYLQSASTFSTQSDADTSGEFTNITSTSSSSTAGSGVSSDLTTNAKAALLQVESAVSALAKVQGTVGAAENTLNYAISLAQSQITNYSSAQSQIRDADVASEAANLTKAQVLQQASIAAMAQANSAPQAVLSLLKG
jgi:flagellin